MKNKELARQARNINDVLYDLITELEQSEIDNDSSQERIDTLEYQIEEYEKRIAELELEISEITKK